MLPGVALTWPIRLALVCSAAVFLVFYHAEIYHAVSHSLTSVRYATTRRIDSAAYIDVVIPTDSDAWPYRRFKSSPLTPPNITYTRSDHGELAEGYLLLSAKSRGNHVIQQSAPFIISHDNELVYAFNESHGTNDFRVQDIDGRPHLTFWQGETTVGHGYGHLVMLDDEYAERTMMLGADIVWYLGGNRPEPPGMMDFHEQVTTSRGTVLVNAYNNTPVDLTPYGGRENGWVSDSVIYEIDVHTNDIVFSWSALDHIALNDSNLPIRSYQGEGTEKQPWDYFHVNSMQAIGDDAFLINSRHTWACYLISRADGHVIWELSGRGTGGSFGPLPDPAGTFRWQHDARAHNITPTSMEISFFDNHNMVEDNGTLPTRGLVLGISLPPDPAQVPTILADVGTSPDIYADSQGSFDPALANGNRLMGYGPIPMVREFSPAWDGSRLLWEGQFGDDDAVQSYRTYKAEWHATPRDWDPSLALQVKNEGMSGEKQVTAYVSWNGATDVEAWNVYTGDCERGPRLRGRAAARGFETVFRMSVQQGSCIQVAAVRGRTEVRRSNMMTVT